MGNSGIVTVFQRRLGRKGRRNARIEINWRTGRQESASEVDLWQHLRARLSEFPVTNAAFPFCGGAVGYFGYEAGGFVEALPESLPDDLDLPDVYLLFADWVVIHDHQDQRSWLSIHSWAEDVAVAREEIEARRHWVLERLMIDRQHDPSRFAMSGRTKLSVRAPWNAAAYVDRVQQVRQLIAAGDAFEVCLTQRLESPGPADPWALYRRLRDINPAPFASYLAFPEVTLVGSSPERFLRLDADREAESRPIKGTRRRGETPEEDEALRTELAASVKDRAENMMIVDLVRNDLGRVCAFHSVEVPHLMKIEAYATVFQMVSTVRGRLREPFDALDLIRACFPGGSMTGAPKVEAMKIIRRLEASRRGPYSGSVGYLDFSGTLDLNIVIRTLVLVGDRAYYGSGGAVVYDSDPVSEYQEMLDKAHALQRALASFEDERIKTESSTSQARHRTS